MVRTSQNRTPKNRHATVWFDRTLCTKLIREKVWYSLLVLLFGLYENIAMSPARRPLSRARSWNRHMVALGGKARDRANVGRGAHVGIEYATPHQSAALCGTMTGCNL